MGLSVKCDWRGPIRVGWVVLGVGRLTCYHRCSGCCRIYGRGGYNSVMRLDLSIDTRSYAANLPTTSKGT